YNSGASSLVIIMLSGLFVGMVLRLQGFQPLQRFGSAEALDTATAIGLVKELGLVVTALLFAGRAGTRRPLMGVQIMGVDAGSFWRQMRAGDRFGRHQSRHCEKLHIWSQRQSDRRVRGL